MPLPCCGKKKKKSTEPAPPGLIARVTSSRPCLILFTILAWYSGGVCVASYISSSNTVFEQVGINGASDFARNGLVGPTINSAGAPAGSKSAEVFDLWWPKKPADDTWIFAFYFGSSAMRVCTNVTDADKWTEDVMGLPTYELAADFEGLYPKFKDCSLQDLVSSCNINCKEQDDCALSCNDLLNTTTTNLWLWKYWLKEGAGAYTKPCVNTNATNATSANRRLENVELNHLRRRADDANVDRRFLADDDVCPEAKNKTNGVKPASRNFMSDPDGPNYKDACNFNFTRFISKVSWDAEAPCEDGNSQVLSIVHINYFVRFILLAGVAAKFFSLFILYAAAITTPADDNPRKNLRMTLCLATPGAAWWICGCFRGDRGKEIVAETMKNAPLRPPIDGCLAFTQCLCSLWLIIGLLIMTVGVEINFGTAIVWSAVAIETSTLLLNLKTNLCTKFKARNDMHLGCLIPWPRYVAPIDEDDDEESDDEESDDEESDDEEKDVDKVAPSVINYGIIAQEKEQEKEAEIEMATVAVHVPQTHTENKTVSIAIPQGMRAGNQITVNLPNGKTVAVTIPKGMHAGNMLTINYEMEVENAPAKPTERPRRTSFHTCTNTGGVYEHDETSGDSRWLSDAETKHVDPILVDVDVTQPVASTSTDGDDGVHVVNPASHVVAVAATEVVAETEDSIGSDLTNWFEENKLKLTEEVVSALQEIGVESPEDFEDLDTDDIENICGVMKKIQAKRFRAALSISEE